MEAGDTTALHEPTAEEHQTADNIIWVFFCLVLVALVQPGFACYEVGATAWTSSTHPILLKKIGAIAASLVAWVCFGYALASGEDAGGLLGTSFFFFADNPFAETRGHGAALAFLGCLYQWSFAAACATIVSGAFLTSGLFYPALAHWVWADEGWASASRNDPLLGCGVIDFAGSGVVHMLGGGMAFFIAYFMRPRTARFFAPYEFDQSTNLKNHTSRWQINEADFRSKDTAWMTLGCFLLWIGWYGFNSGSTLEISTVGSQKIAGRAAMNTTIAAAFGCIFSVMIEIAYHVRSPTYRRGGDIDDPLHKAQFDWDVNSVDNNTTDALILSMLTAWNEDDGIVDKIRCHRQVDNAQGPWWRTFTWPYSTHMSLHGAAVSGILAGCATMSYGSAVGVSFVSALLYHVSYRVFICLKIDDAVGASAIHFACGFWGLLASGFTATEATRLDAGYPSNDECSRVSQYLANTLLAVIIMFYALFCTVILRSFLKTLGLTTAVNAPRRVADDLAALRRFVEWRGAAVQVALQEMLVRVDDLEANGGGRNLAGLGEPVQRRNDETEDQLARLLIRVDDLEANVVNAAQEEAENETRPSVAENRQVSQ